MDFFSRLFNRPAVPSVDVSELKSRLAQTPRPFLLDVRTSDEYKAGHVGGAVLIPLHELSAKLARIPKDQEVICICASGNRSKTAVRQLIAQGYQASSVVGGTSAWVRAGLPVKTGLGK